MIHVVHGLARGGRVRRAEYVRRFFDSQAIVVGCLDDECRCAGLGLRSIGSTPKRLLCSALTQAIRFERTKDARPVLICAWSTEDALELASVFQRLLLIADSPPPPGVDSDLTARIEVIAPDADVARAWSRSGAHRTRILPPCALAAWGPSSSDAGGPISVALFPREGGSEEEAVSLLHRVGLAHIGGVEAEIRVNASDPSFDVMFDYAQQTLFDSAIYPMESGAFPGNTQVAMVAGVRDAHTDERVLDLLAQGVAVMVFRDEPFEADEAISFEACGIEQFQSAETNAGARVLTILSEDRSFLRVAQSRARDFASTRDPREWCTTLGVAASSMSASKAD